MFKKLFGFGKKEEDEPEIVEEEVVEADESESAQESDSDESVEELQEEPVVDMVIEEPSVETVIEDEPIVVVEEPVEEVVEETVEAVADEPAPQKKSFFGKLMDGLNKTRKGITDQIDNLLNNYGEIDDDLFDELEEILIMADVGMNTTMKIIASSFIRFFLL